MLPVSGRVVGILFIVTCTLVGPVVGLGLGSLAKIISVGVGEDLIVGNGDGAIKVGVGV